jgi:hypothetical protein
LSDVPEISCKQLLKTLGRYEDSPAELVIELVKDDYIALGTPEEVGEIQATEQIKVVLTDEPTDVKTIAKGADVTEKLARRILEKLKEAKQVERTGAGKKADPHLYCLINGHNSLLSQSHPSGEETKSNGPNGITAIDALRLLGGKLV